MAARVHFQTSHFPRTAALEPTSDRRSCGLHRRGNNFTMASGHSSEAAEGFSYRIGGSAVQWFVAARPGLDKGRSLVGRKTFDSASIGLLFAFRLTFHSPSIRLPCRLGASFVEIGVSSRILALASSRTSRRPPSTKGGFVQSQTWISAEIKRLQNRAANPSLPGAYCTCPLEQITKVWA